MLAALDALRQVAGLPGLDPLRRGVDGAQLLHEVGELHLPHGAREGRHALGEGARGLRGLHHLVLAGPLGPVLVPEGVGELVALGEEPVEHLHVLRVAAQVVLPVQVAADVVAIGVEHHREEVRLVRAQRHGAVRVLRVGREEVGGEARQGGVPVGDAQGAPAGHDVPVELLADVDQLLLELPHPLPGGVVPVHAAAPVVADRVLHVAADVLGGVGPEGQPGEALVGAPVQVELGHEGRDPLAGDLGRLAHPLVGVHRREQLRQPGDLPHLTADTVEGHGHLLGGGVLREREQRVQPAPGPLQLTVDEGGEGGGVVLGHRPMLVA